MFKITRAVKQIFSAARNLGQTASVSINSMVKYCTQSKGYIEDASDEFTFLKALASQSSKASIQDKFKAFTPNLGNIAKTKSTQLLDSAEIRKLIYARFSDEIAAKLRGAEENKKLETKSYEIKEHVETFTTCNIAEEFKELRSQGYDFTAAKKTVQNQNVKSLSERMKELSISGYISNYAGEPSLREDIEKVNIQKGLVINEFMERVAGKIEEPEEYSTELLG